MKYFDSIRAIFMVEQLQLLADKLCRGFVDEVIDRNRTIFRNSSSDLFTKTIFKIHRSRSSKLYMTAESLDRGFAG